MAKETTTITLDGEIRRMAKAKGINISQFVENCLRGACEEDLEKKDKFVVTEQINQLEGKLEQLKATKRGIDEKELVNLITGHKESEIIEIDDDED